MKETTRREFLQLSGTAVGVGYVRMHMPMLLALGQTACTARDSGAPLQHLDSATATDLAAIAAQIIPSDDRPGANEAGVIYFIDAAFGGFMSGAKPFLLDQLVALNADVPRGRFGELSLEDQRTLLAKHDQGPLFGMLHFLTIAGMFSMPRHGGNRDHVGWDLLGFDHTHGWQPPFGYYDRDAHND